MPGPSKSARKKKRAAVRKKSPEVKVVKKDDFGIHPSVKRNATVETMGISNILKAVKNQGEKGLVDLEDWHEFQINTTGLPLGLPETIGDDNRPLKYLRLTPEAFQKDPRRKYLIPVIEGDDRFKGVDRMDFRDGVLMQGELIVCAMLQSTYDNICKAEKARIESLNKSMCPIRSNEEGKERDGSTSEGHMDSGLVNNSPLKSLQQVKDKTTDLGKMQDMAAANA